MTDTTLQMDGNGTHAALAAHPVDLGACVLVSREHLQSLLDALHQRGYRVLGPTLHDHAIVYDEITTLADLPAGWTDIQDGGSYRVQQGDDAALFGYTVSPQSWKPFLHPPKRRLWYAERASASDDFAIVPDEPEIPRQALLGVRACELHALAIQDKVLMQGHAADPVYAARREQTFIVAVNCGQAGGTCFCTSMQTGPQVTFGFDLALTELLHPDRHVFLVEVGTAQGAAVMHDVPHAPATGSDIAAAQQIVAATAHQMGRTFDTADLKPLLDASHDHPRFDDIAERCMLCGNCTAVCPTCFCTTVEDVTDLTGSRAERWQRWDSCFTADFSYIYSGSIRSSAKARYRQWLTHKFATWVDQFGTMGCVGCGRCITWCPVGIDVTAELAAIRTGERATPPKDCDST